MRIMPSNLGSKDRTKVYEDVFAHSYKYKIYLKMDTVLYIYTLPRHYIRVLYFILLKTAGQTNLVGELFFAYYNNAMFTLLA